MTQQTRQWLRELRLPAMDRAYLQQMELPASDALGFDERFALLVQAEWESQKNKKLARLLKTASLRDKGACLEEIDFQKNRNIEKNLVANLADCRWIRKGYNLLISGACGTGKTYLASAFGNAACRKGYSVRCFRLPRLLTDLHIGRGDGSWEKTLKDLKKPDMLILDDFGLAPLEPLQCRDFLEIVEDRHGSASIIISSQPPISSWHSVFDDATIADAVLDRLLENALRFELKGPSRRHHCISSFENG
ncbi:MAG: IS21-like element helper ATPase IstB [Treponema sp.]|jgi:DNA replication protein DnaC|nr:IS21-like element helper ATPase IstB [Treponema sp.]